MAKKSTEERMNKLFGAATLNSGTRRKTVGGPDPSNRNVGSAKGRSFEDEENRAAAGKIARQALDDENNRTGGFPRLKKKKKK